MPCQRLPKRRVRRFIAGGPACVPRCGWYNTLSHPASTCSVLAMAGETMARTKSTGSKRSKAHRSAEPPPDEQRNVSRPRRPSRRLRAEAAREAAPETPPPKLLRDMRRNSAKKYASTSACITWKTIPQSRMPISTA